MIIVIGGGPAGFMAAITARRARPGEPVLLLEQGADVLRKVAVSGGGRCNVTHACFDPRELVKSYPRGGRELRGPFHHFGPAETEAWFAAEGVRLKTEDDGRMFPVTDRSATIVEALVGAARTAGVEVRTRTVVTALERTGEGFGCRTSGGDLAARAVVLATGGRTSAGGGPSGYDLAAALGHTIVPPVPSLFTFRSSAPLLAGLAGVATEVRLKAEGLDSSGPLLITHKGVSGPAVLRLSAWGARALCDRGYAFELAVDWLPATADADALLRDRIRDHGKRQIAGDHPHPLPARLWAALVRECGIPDPARWADLGKEPRRRLASALKGTILPVTGQAPFKEEFVTCGGVALAEVDFRTMASRPCPGLHLAGEVLDIDGITGGFNFQNCWTTGWLAGRGAADG
ncbi:MAG TPA: NAD(P)/FAD-dependent oxidoreductase [Candidatus Krumholzibacteria bacterium]|nr:NAD(P)/FAD-dependent oxidoreductase [Candidatus Krumholzibacteria bacterium]